MLRELMIAAVLFYAGEAPGSSVTPGPQRQEPKRTVIAVVETVNIIQKTVVVLDTWAKATAFTLGPGSRIRSQNDELKTIDDLQPGVRVQITYEGTPESPGNIVVTILPRQNSGVFFGGIY